ncbi:MAG: carbohydrate ABC transporter permease [Bacteroidota bacterium]
MRQASACKPTYRKYKDRASILLMLAPTLLLFAAFCAYPLAYVIRTSFFEYNGFTAMKWLGLDNYLRALGDESWWSAVWNTIQLGIGIPLLQIPVALVLAVVLNEPLKGRAFFRTFFFLPAITSTAIMGLIFYFMFSSFNGIINGLLMRTGLIGMPIDWLGREWTAKFVIVLFSTWANAGFYMVLFLAALQKIPRDVYEVAATDGANALQIFFRITVPLLGQMFKIITMLSIVNAMKLFDTIKVLTGGGPGNRTEVMTMYIFRYFFEYNTGIMQIGYTSAAAVIGLLIVGIISAVYYLSTKRISHGDETAGA